MKGRSDTHWSNGRGDLRSSPHPPELPICERKRSKEFSASRKEPHTPGFLEM